MSQKLTEEEIQMIRELELSYAQITTELGKTALERISLQKMLEKLDEIDALTAKRLSDLRNNEDAFVKIINEKYGVGRVNLETGEFIPSNS